MATDQTTYNQKKVFSIYRLSDPQPDWSETDPSQPDYIKNKEWAERFRPIQVNGVDILSDSYDSGKVNFVSGKNVSIKAKDNQIIISATGEGGVVYEDVVYVAGNGINITDLEDGQKLISVQPEIIPSIVIGDVIPTTQIDKDIIPVITNFLADGHTITPITAEVVTKQAWETLVETGIRLINQSEIDKLNALVLGEDGKIQIDGPINVSSIHGLGAEVVDIVTGIGDYISTPAIGKEGDDDYVPATIISKLGIARGAQVNVIESILLPDGILSINDKQVTLPAFSEGKYGVIKSLAIGQDGYLANVVYSRDDGAGEVKKISTDILENGEKTLVLCGGGAFGYTDIN